MIYFASKYYPNLRLDSDKALRVWRAMYRQILDFHFGYSSNWLFVDFQDLLDGRALESIEDFLEVGIDREFVDTQLVHTAPTYESLDGEINEIYAMLTELASPSQSRSLGVAQRVAI